LRVYACQHARAPAVGVWRREHLLPGAWVIIPRHGSERARGAASTVLAELPSHLNDPARAWPAAVRNELPDRGTMLAALLVALGLLAALAAAALWLLGRVRGDARKGRRAARWAAPSDLRRLRVKGPARGRVILGRHQRQLAASEPRTSVLVVAPTVTEAWSKGLVGRRRGRVGCEGALRLTCSAGPLAAGREAPRVVPPLRWALQPSTLARRGVSRRRPSLRAEGSR
jgi:hypothetical protein